MIDLRATPAGHAPPARRHPAVVFRRPAVWVVLGVVAALAAAAVVVAGFLPSVGVHGDALLARLPVLVALAVVLVRLPGLAGASPGAARDAVHRRTLVGAVRVVVPATAVVATWPGTLWPATTWPATAAPGAGAGLPWLATAALGTATTAVLVVVLLAVRAWFALAVALVGAAVLLAEGIATGVQLGVGLGASVGDGLVRGAAAGAVAGALLAVTVWLRRRPRRAGLGAATRRGLLYAVVVTGVLVLVRPLPTVWACVVVLLAVGLAVPPLLVWWVLARIPAPTPRPPGPAPEPVRVDPFATVTVGGGPDEPSGPLPGLRILHLVGDDPQVPGAGARARRAAEIDRRLAAAGHRITVVCRRQRGIADRTEHHGRGWVHWVHPVGGGLGYAVAAAICARSVAADLVVEEFLAPFATIAAPRWTSRPVVGVVGWFDVDPAGRRLRDRLVRWAVRRHRTLVAVSVDVAEAVAAVHPRAEVVVIGHGVPPRRPASVRGDDVVCTAPLHIAPQGLDLLLDAWARVAPDLPGRLVLTGTGPQDGAVRVRVHELGLSERVVITGTGGASLAALAAARVAVVPSRYEASGIAALEALSVGTPVVAVDLPPLREVVLPETGVLVGRTGDDAADAAAFARALWALYRDDERRERAARWGPGLASAHDWDTLAGMQEDVYRAVAGPVARWAD